MAAPQTRWAISCCGQAHRRPPTTALRAAPSQTKDFLYKLNVVEEELDETQFCLELFTQAKLVDGGETQALIKEADELLAITMASAKTARGGRLSK